MKDKKLIVQSIIGLASGALFMGLVYLCMNKAVVAKFMPHGKSGGIVYFLSVVLAPFLAIALHEAGHLFAGLAQGFRLEMYIVGFLGIKRENNRVKVYFNKDLYYFGGMAATMPVKKYPDLKKRFAIIVIAGPLFSLITGLLFMLVFAFTNTAFNAFWGLCCLFSFAVFLGTMLPSKTGVFFSDRKRFQRLMDKGKAGDIELALLETMNQSMVDDNYKNLSVDKLQVIKSDTDQFIQFWGKFYEFQYYKEFRQDEFTESLRQNLFEYKSYLPKSIWLSLKIEQ